MVRPTHAFVDLERLVWNYHVIRRHLSSSRANTPPRIISVIKANAYGHGAVEIARALEAPDGSFGQSILACADIEEGIQLRQAGIRAPVLVFGALSVSDLEGLFKYDLTPTVSSPAAAHRLRLAARSRGCKLRVHVKVDTGMNRFGFRHDNIQQTLPEIIQDEQLLIDGVYTHFATAENMNHPLFDHQCARFETVRSVVRKLGLRDTIFHAANSAAMLRDQRTWYDAVRPGLLLYGVVPPPLKSLLPVKPVMSLRSRVVAVKGMRTGESTGYGANFVAARPMRVAVIPAGYADGLDLRLAGKAAVLVRGQRSLILSVSMDSAVIDVSRVEVSPGDPVVLVGEQGKEHIDTRELAGLIGTVPHEILCRTGIRIARVYEPASFE